MRHVFRGKQSSIISSTTFYSHIKMSLSEGPVWLQIDSYERTKMSWFQWCLWSITHPMNFILTNLNLLVQKPNIYSLETVIYARNIICIFAIHHIIEICPHAVEALILWQNRLLLDNVVIPCPFQIFLHSS